VWEGVKRRKESCSGELTNGDVAGWYVVWRNRSIKGSKEGVWEVSGDRTEERRWDCRR